MHTYVKYIMLKLDLSLVIGVISSMIKFIKKPRQPYAWVMGGTSTCACNADNNFGKMGV